MTLGHRKALADLARVTASRDSLQVALDDMRRQVRLLDVREETLTRHGVGVSSK